VPTCSYIRQQAGAEQHLCYPARWKQQDGNSDAACIHETQRIGVLLLLQHLAVVWDAGRAVKLVYEFAALTSDAASAHKPNL
jgi:hypothetical protein